MNKRLTKKILKQSKVRINKIKVLPDEYIIMSYDTNLIGCREFNNVYKYISSKNEFINKVIALPKDIRMSHGMSKEKFIEFLENYIEKLKLIK